MHQEIKQTKAPLLGSLCSSVEEGIRWIKHDSIMYHNDNRCYKEKWIRKKRRVLKIKVENSIDLSQKDMVISSLTSEQIPEGHEKVNPAAPWKKA